jgi:hypothetical protein
MSKSLFFALVMLLATFLSAYADEASDKKLSLGVGATYGFETYDTHLHGTQTPGFSITLDYALDTRSSLFLNYTRQTIKYDGDYRVTKNLATLGYKYWLTDSQKWRPWVQAGAGYDRRHSEFSYDWQGSHYNYEYNTGDFQISFGGGVRYELQKNLGATASAVLYKDGAPWHWRYQAKLLSTSIGLEYNF